MSKQEYREFALTGEGKLYELWDGVPREKPLMNVMHGMVAAYLGFALADRLDRRIHRVNINGGRMRCFAAKLRAYRERGDEEIWYLHPFERTLTAWHRQPDESYTEELFRGGIVPVVSLPGVTIDFDALLDG